MLAILLSLAEFLFGTWWKGHQSQAELLGKAEQKSETLNADNAALLAQAQAAADAPATKTAMERLLEEGKL